MRLVKIISHERFVLVPGPSAPVGVAEAISAAVDPYGFQELPTFKYWLLPAAFDCSGRASMKQ